MRILVVDDDDMVRFVCSGMLHMIHHEVVEVSSGAAALDIVRKDTAAFDVILLDDGMPEMDGLETFRNLIQIGYRNPVVICSGRDVSIDAFQVLPDSPPLAVLIKPFTIQRLQAALASVLPR